MKKESWYNLVYSIVRPFGYLFFPQKTIGRENIPDGPALICASHSNGIDPLLLAFAIGRKNYVRHMAKAELRKVPVVGWVLEKAGIIFVKRGERDIDSFKSCMRALKSGEKIVMFPEGTRVHGDEVVAAKSGAVHMAARTGTPIVPVYIPRDKKIFHCSPVIIGEPYSIKVENRDDFDSLSQELMDHIWALGEERHE